MGLWEWTALAGALMIGAVLGTLFRLARKPTPVGSRTPLQKDPGGVRGQVQGSGQRVLVADDSATIRKVLELTLMSLPFDVVEARTAAEACELLNKEIFALAFIDVHFPEPEQGYEVFRLCRQVAPQTPIVLLAGTFETDIDPTHALEAQAVLKKPFDSREALALVQQLTGKGPGS